MCGPGKALEFAWVSFVSLGTVFCLHRTRIRQPSRPVLAYTTNINCEIDKAWAAGLLGCWALEWCWRHPHGPGPHVHLRNLGGLEGDPQRVVLGAVGANVL